MKEARQWLCGHKFAQHLLRGMKERLTLQGVLAGDPLFSMEDFKKLDKWDTTSWGASRVSEAFDSRVILDQCCYLQYWPVGEPQPPRLRMDLSVWKGREEEFKSEYWRVFEDENVVILHGLLREWKDE